MKIEFMASLWKVQRDHEDECKVTLTTDAQQLGIVNQIPSQALLKITVEVVE